jgi:hypothetical protein
MESEAKKKAADKLISKACDWLECRNAKNGSTGADKEAAKTKERTAQHNLASATEEFQKER